MIRTLGNRYSRNHHSFVIRWISRGLISSPPTTNLFKWKEEESGGYASVTEGLKHVYKTKLLPLEQHYKFHDFHSPLLQDADFDALPMIMLVGQYSTGKTTFIRYLLEKDFPGIRIGPEPTTDRFIALMYGREDGVVPGNALVVDPTKQFKPLSKFGNTFLNKFQCSITDSEVLRSLCVVDTPGILSGEKQRVDRGYNFSGVIEWFAERVDRILLLFDAHKLDISDEFKRVIESLHGHDDKIRIVLNKADLVDHQQLMRVYGALMWSLGKILSSPEVARVYTGSFWDQPLHIDTNRRLFEAEEQDLFKDLQSLPRNAVLRKLNDLIKRARLAKVHAYIIGTLRAEMPMLFGKEDAKQRLILNLDKIYKQIESDHGFSPGDFPNIDKMKEVLQQQEFNKFNTLHRDYIVSLDTMLENDISNLLAAIPMESPKASEKSGSHGDNMDTLLTRTSKSPFKLGHQLDTVKDGQHWIVDFEREPYDVMFDSLDPVNGKISSTKAKIHFDKSKLPNSVLNKVWRLADVDQDGMLDRNEFCLAMYLISIKLNDNDLPDSLPPHLIPPDKIRRVG